MNLRTWGDLSTRIAVMSPEQRKQPIQCVLPTSDDNDVQEALPGIAMATIDEFEFYKCRSTYDNKYNANDVVLLLDYNPFAEDGAIAFACEEDTDTPIYGSNGPTPREEQYSPQALIDSRPIV